VGAGRRPNATAARQTSCARRPERRPIERLKAVRSTAEGETIVQASRITSELAEILKKLDISRPKPILAVG